MSSDQRSNVIVIDSSQQNQHKQWENQSYQQKQTFINDLLKILEQVPESQQKQLQIIKLKLIQVKTSSHQINYWIDALRIVSAIKEQISYLSHEPSDKELSKHFAKHFLKHIQKNPEQKRYRFLKVCIHGLRGLGLNFHASAWLNKFVNVNKRFLSGFDLSKYNVKSNQHIRKKILKLNIENQRSFQTNKQLSQKIKPNGKINEETNDIYSNRRQLLQNKKKIIEKKSIKNIVRNQKGRFIKKT